MRSPARNSSSSSPSNAGQPCSAGAAPVSVGSGVGSAQSSARRFHHERADPCLVGGGQLRQSEGDRPHGAFREVRRVVKAERRVPRLELLRGLEEADDLFVLGIRGHAVPEFRREDWRAGPDDGIEPLRHGAIGFRHLADLCEHDALAVRLFRGRLRLSDAVLDRRSLLVRECLISFGRGSALGGLLRVLHCRFPLSHSVCCPLAAALSRGPDVTDRAPPLTLVARRQRAASGRCFLGAGDEGFPRIFRRASANSVQLPWTRPRSAGCEDPRKLVESLPWRRKRPPDVGRKRGPYPGRGATPRRLRGYTLMRLYIARRLFARHTWV